MIGPFIGRLRSVHSNCSFNIFGSHRCVSCVQILSLIVTLGAGLKTNIAVADPTELVLGGLSVVESKPNGTPWDLGFGAMSRPDLVIEIWIGDDRLIATPKVANSHSAAKVLSAPTFDLIGEQELIIKVIDKDLKADDLVERFSLKVNPNDVREYKRFELSGKSVISLTIQLKPPSSSKAGPPIRDAFASPPKREGGAK